MPSIKEELIELLNEEVLISNRKTFGMYGQINFKITGIDPENLYVEIATGRKDRKSDPVQVAANVRNAILNVPRDMLPCKKIDVEYKNYPVGNSYTHPDKYILTHVVLPFVDDFKDEPLPSSLIPIEEVLITHRAKYQVS